MKKFSDYLEKPWAANAFAICCGVVLYLFLSHFYVVLKGLSAFTGFVFPVMLGLVIAYVLNPMARIIHKYVLRRSHFSTRSWCGAVAITIIIVLVLVSIFVIALIPQMVSSIRRWFGNLSYYARTLETLIGNLSNSSFFEELNIDLTAITSFWQEFVARLTSFLRANSSTVLNTITSVSNGVITGVISFIMAVYFLTSKGRLKAGLRRFFLLIMTEEHFHEFTHFARKCNVIIERYIWFDLIDGLLVGLVNAAFMVIMKMPLVILVSVVAGVTNLAPTFGPIVGCIIGSIVLVLAKPISALWFIIFTIVLQLFDGYILKPRLFGGTFGVPAIWILIMIIVCGRMFGVIGILLGIPFAAISDYIYHDYILTGLEEHKRRKQEEEMAETEKKHIDHIIV